VFLPQKRDVTSGASANLLVQQDIVPTAKKHTTIWGKKSSPEVTFI
jgi:hypothetical protein